MLIETLQWLRYLIQSWRNWAVKLLYWTAVLRSTIEIPIKVLLIGLSFFSTYHPNIIRNSRQQLVKHQTDILLFPNSVRYFALFPNSVRNRLYVWLINTPQIWSKQLSAPPQSVALECNDQSQKWQHCPIVLFITLKCAELLWNFHQLIATSSLAIWFLWFSFFPSPHSLSFFLMLLLC